MKDQMEVGPLARWNHLVLRLNSYPPITERHSLSPSSFTRLVIELLYSRSTLAGTIRAYHVSYEYPKRERSRHCAGGACVYERREVNSPA
jgi:hypothetical protein